MSSLVDSFEDSTVLLLGNCNPNQFFTKKDIKKILPIKSSTFYSASGHHRREIHLLERALSIAHHSYPIRSHWLNSINVNCTGMVVLSPSVACNSFYLLKYHDMTVEGFNLHGTCIEELDKLLDQYEKCYRIHCSLNSWIQTASSNIQYLQKILINDQCVLSYDITPLELLKDAYGMQAILDCVQQIQKWVNQYCWR
jgi:hypothetical protein